MRYKEYVVMGANVACTAPNVSPAILLVDDDVELCALISDFLSQNGFKPEAVHDGRSGLKRALDARFDLVILDVMLPVLEGFDVLRLLRKHSSVPVIMLSARTQQVDRITGLDAGADDYLPKPFEPEELVSRIRAVLRRTGKAVSRSAILEAGGVRIDTQTRRVQLKGKPLDLTAVEYDILEFLVRAAGRVVGRDELAAMLYQRESTPYERTMDVHVSHLRTKLDDNEHVLIRTIRGAGYLFAGEAGS